MPRYPQRKTAAVFLKCQAAYLYELRVKDLGIKLADPSKLLLPRYKLGSKSCVLIVDINKENPGMLLAKVTVLVILSS